MWGQLVPEIERHEGVTQATNSHWGVATQAYQTLHLAALLERVYTGPVFTGAMDDDTERYAEYQAWLDFHAAGSPFDQRQAQFDTTDYPLVNQAIGCTLDYNSKDP